MSALNQHKSLAMGKGLKSSGAATGKKVPAPGYKKGGRIGTGKMTKLAKGGTVGCSKY